MQTAARVLDPRLALRAFAGPRPTNRAGKEGPLTNQGRELQGRRPSKGNAWEWVPDPFNRNKGGKRHTTWGSATHSIALGGEYATPPQGPRPRRTATGKGSTPTNRQPSTSRNIVSLIQNKWVARAKQQKQNTGGKKIMLGRRRVISSWWSKLKKEWAKFCDLHKPQQSCDKRKLYNQPIGVWHAMSPWTNV